MTTGNGTGKMSQAIWSVESLRIEPCILVSERLTIDRAVSYHRTDKQVTTYADGSEDKTWETQRHFRCKEEAKVAEQVYANARYRIRAQCLYTELGYVCAEEQRADLELAISDAKEMVEEANKSFRHCQIRFRVLCTPLLPDNESGQEMIKESLERVRLDVQEALTAFDFKRVRHVLSSTRNLSTVLGSYEHRQELDAFRSEIRGAAADMAALVKKFGNAENAILSHDGQRVLKRATASWNF